MNILTDKCFKIETKGLGDHGWQVVDTMMATGLEVLAMLAFDEKGGETSFDYTLMNGDMPNREQVEPAELTEAALWMLTRVESRHPARKRRAA